MNQPPPPSPFGPEDQWLRWRHDRRRTLPAWHADRDYVTSHALAQLPRVCGELRVGETMALMERPRWWPGPALSAEALRRHGLGALPGLLPVVALRLEPGSYDLLLIDRITGEWSVPNLTRTGDDLVGLAAWRWGISEIKAAWRLARLCGLRKPTP